MRPGPARGAAPRRSIPILFAGTTYALGGAERILSHLVRGLNRDPFQVEILALREPGPIGEELAGDGIPVHSGLTGSGRIDPLLPLRIRRLLMERRFQAIYFLDHAHAVFYGTMASFRTGVRVRLMPVHTTGQWDGRPSLGRPIRLVRPALNRIIAIAEAQKRYLVEKEGVPEGQITVIPNGIPLGAPEGEAGAALRRAVRLELGVAEDTPVVGITAVLRPEKNHELLLEAMVEVRRSVPGAQLWIVGDGPRRDFLEETARRLGLAGPEESVSPKAQSSGTGDGGAGTPVDGTTGAGSSVAAALGAADAGASNQACVRFLGRRSDARRIMAGFDAAVLSSHPRVETQPLALLEAMDAGLPVVSTRVGALHEMVEDGVSGLLVPPGDAQALAAAIVTLLRDPERRERFGSEGRRIVHRRFSVETMVNATAELILRLL